MFVNAYYALYLIRQNHWWATEPTTLEEKVFVLTVCFSLFAWFWFVISVSRLFEDLLSNQK